MKKIYSCVVTLFLSTSVSVTAQNKTYVTDIPENKENKIYAPAVNVDNSLLPNSYKTTTNHPTERWYNYGETMSAILQGGILTGNALFPDTTILVRYGQTGGPYTYSGPWIHNLGDVLDVTSAYFNDPDVFPGALSLGKTSSFKLDTIAVHCRYERNTNAAIVDTLVIEVAVNHLANEGLFSGSPVNTFLNADSVFVKTIPYSYTTNSLDFPSKKTYKIHLTAADTGNNRYFLQATADLGTVLPGNYVVSSVKFVPGYTWTANTDTLSAKNNIFFYSIKEQNDGPPLYAKRDFNVSYVILSQIRYNMPNNGWNGRFIPSFALMGGSTTPANQWQYEHHRIFYKVSCLSDCWTTSTNDLAASEFTNGIKLFQNQPNPSNGSILISYELGESSYTTLFVYDITGKRVMALNEGKKQAGKHSVSIASNQLKSGIYFYTLSGTAGNSLTKKMIITE